MLWRQLCSEALVHRLPQECGVLVHSVDLQEGVAGHLQGLIWWGVQIKRWWELTASGAWGEQTQLSSWPSTDCVPQGAYGAMDHWANTTFGVVFYVAGTVVGTSGVFILTTALAGRHYYPHFTHRETEAQRGKVIP